MAKRVGNKVIVTIPNMDHYEGIKLALYEMLAQVGLKYNQAPHMDLDGKHLAHYAELLSFLELREEGMEDEE